MKFHSRAYRYVTRKKSKTLLLVLIMTISAIMLLGSISILQSIQAQRQLIGEKSQTKISININNAETPISEKDIEQINTIENIAWLNRICSILASPVNFELAPGAETPQENKAKIYGYDDTAADGSFEAQLLRLQSGSHIDPNSSYAVLLHTSLAEVNRLSVGDTVSFRGENGQIISATVQGIYQPLSASDNGGQHMPTAGRAENLIYATHDFIQDMQGVQKYEQVFAYLKDPEHLQETQDSLSSILPGHKISAHDALFKRMQGTLAQIEKSSILVLILTSVTAIVAVTLLLCMWTRERMREFAILLSLGNTSKEIFLQVLTELLILFTASMALALPAAYFSLPFLGRLFYNGAAENNLEISMYGAGALPVYLSGLLVMVFVAFLALLPLANNNIKALLSHTD